MHCWRVPNLEQHESDHVGPVQYSSHVKNGRLLSLAVALAPRQWSAWHAPVAYDSSQRDVAQHDVAQFALTIMMWTYLSRRRRLSQMLQRWGDIKVMPFLDPAL